ncbi:hypothetical protein FocTR4_00008987 [Fusarium oxysporum f. sp. cubense]|uniref:Uncharacterized protein n=1 Tax=Fusarium oxysporum f. sp. cubense TaxID=61366 RepID=A0A5C6STH0_FUSOC|nr:hypothetical protein FocTR4_00008987 [Fusarium oxysporum f. sp. cubense]
MMQSKFAYLALVYLGLMTLADSVTDSLLPTRSGRWNLATAALILKGVSDIIGQSVIGYFLNTNFTSYYWTGATSVLAQALGPFFASILTDQSRVLPGILSGTCCLIGFGIVDSLKPPPYESNNSSHDESTSLLPNNQNDVELKTLSISVTEYLSRCFGKKSLIRSSSLIFLPQVLFLMAICKSTRPLFKTYIQHRDDVSPTEAEALWLLRSVMSVLIFGIILPAIVLGTAPRVSYPNSINLRVARISVLFISTGAFMIGLSGSLRSITTAIDLSLIALASCSFSSSDAGTVMMTLASIESAGTLLGIGVLYPIYQWSINEGLPFLAGGVPYYICGSLYAVTAVVVWSLRTRRQAPDS